MSITYKWDQTNIFNGTVAILKRNGYYQNAFPTKKQFENITYRLQYYRKISIQLK